MPTFDAVDVSSTGTRMQQGGVFGGAKKPPLFWDAKWREWQFSDKEIASGFVAYWANRRPNARPEAKFLGREADLAQAGEIIPLHFIRDLFMRDLAARAA